MLVSSLFPFLLINSYLRKVLDLLVTHYRSSADAWAWEIIFGFNDSTSLMRIISRKMKEPHDGTHHAALKMASPPTTIVPLPVIIAEGRIPLAAERVTAPAIGDSHIASTIKGGVLCAVEVTLAIERYVVARTKLVGVSKTINVGVPCPVHRDVSFTICVETFRPVHRDIPVAIHRNVTARAKLLFSLEVPLTHSFIPGEVSLANPA